MSTNDPQEGVSTSNEVSNGHSVEENSTDVKEENPWATPRQEPVNGVVQPRVLPPIGKPTRHTNQLDYMLNTVLKDAMKHKHAWPFLTPVDTIKLGLTDYHRVVKRPMDLKTVEKRLKNCYYFSAKDCMEDVEQIFKNCYSFNQSEDDVTLMCKNIENLYKDLILNMPKEEIEIQRPTAKREPKEPAKKTEKKAGSVARGGNREADRVLERFHNATLTASRESSVFIQKGVADSSSIADDLSTVQEDSKATTSDIIENIPDQPVKTQKGVKRKADTTTPTASGDSQLILRLNTKSRKIDLNTANNPEINQLILDLGSLSKDHMKMVKQIIEECENISIVDDLTLRLVLSLRSDTLDALQAFVRNLLSEETKNKIVPKSAKEIQESNEKLLVELRKLGFTGDITSFPSFLRESMDILPPRIKFPCEIILSELIDIVVVEEEKERNAIRQRIVVETYDTLVKYCSKGHREDELTGRGRPGSGANGSVAAVARSLSNGVAAPNLDQPVKTQKGVKRKADTTTPTASGDSQLILRLNTKSRKIDSNTANNPEINQLILDLGSLSEDHMKMVKQIIEECENISIVDDLTFRLVLSLRSDTLEALQAFVRNLLSEETKNKIVPKSAKEIQESNEKLLVELRKLGFTGDITSFPSFLRESIAYDTLVKYCSKGHREDELTGGGRPGSGANGSVAAVARSLSNGVAAPNLPVTSNAAERKSSIVPEVETTNSTSTIVGVVAPQNAKHDVKPVAVVSAHVAHMLATPQEKRYSSSVVHEGAKPLLQNTNPFAPARIGGSILDQLLPSAMEPAKPAVSNLNATLDSFKQKNQLKIQRQKALQEEEQKRKIGREDRKAAATPPMGGLGAAPASPFGNASGLIEEDEATRILRLKEQERRKREEEAEK